MLDTSLIAEIESKAPKLSRTDREALIACLTTRVKRHKQRRFFLFYPDTGPLSRALYQKHREVVRAGRRERTQGASGTGAARRRSSPD